MTYSTTLKKQTAYVLVTIAVLFLSGTSFAQKIQSPQAGPLRPNLGTASTYAIFTGAGAINNTGLSKLTGDVGQDGAYQFTGFPPGTYTGTLNRNNGASALAKADLLTAQSADAAVTCGIVLGAGIADGQQFTPAVYCSGGATTTTGNITFDALGDPNAIFIVKIGGQLDANAGTHILLANSAVATNIYWFVDGAVNIADNSTFKGVIIAKGAITFLGTSSLDGRALTTAGAINISANSMGPFVAGPGNNITVTHPAQGDTIQGGTQNYQITWTGTGITSKKIFEYSLDNGLTWKTIDTITSDVFAHSWNVPDTTAAKALVRITDGNNLIGTSGVFTISSSKIIPGAIVILTPTTGQMITGGTQNFQITWSGIGIAQMKTFELSLDSGTTWTMIGSITSDLMTYNWNVPDTASNKVLVRITDGNNVKGVSGIFTILSSKTSGGITVSKPSLGEIIAGGTQNYQIMWSGSGLSSQKTIALSLDGGITWKPIGSVDGDVFTFNWNVPDTASTMAVIRIVDMNGKTGQSGIFTIVSSKGNVGTIVIIHPSTGEVIAGGTMNYQITFTAVNTTQQKTVAYSLDGGANWNLIGFINSDLQTFTWATVPNVATTQALVRIMDANGATGTSGLFTITQTAGAGSINSITLTGLDSKNNIGNAKTLGISWTFTPDIGTSVKVEISVDGMITWIQVADNNISQSQTSWTTKNTGYYNPVFVRLTSSKGMTLTSIPFSIGSNASVSSGTSANGYAISNYPNPATSQTTINFILPVASDVTLRIADGLGRVIRSIARSHYESGSYNILFDASNVPTGMYNYILQTDSITLAGKINVIK